MVMRIDDVITIDRCPFCGDKSCYSSSASEGYAIHCGCGAQGPTADDDDEDGELTAIKLWNNRHVED